MFVFKFKSPFTTSHFFFIFGLIISLTPPSFATNKYLVPVPANSTGCELALNSSNNGLNVVEPEEKIDLDHLKGTFRIPYHLAQNTMVKITDQDGIDNIFSSEQPTAAGELYLPFRIRRSATQLFLRSQHQIKGPLTEHEIRLVNEGYKKPEAVGNRASSDTREHMLLRVLDSKNPKSAIPDLYYLRSYWREFIENDPVFDDFIKLYVERQQNFMKLRESLAIRFQISMSIRNKFSDEVENDNDYEAIDQIVELPNVSINSFVRKIEIPNPRDPNGHFTVFVQTGADVIRVFRISTNALLKLEGTRKDRNTSDLFSEEVDADIIKELKVISAKEFDQTP
jgi:hypothetical protein